MPSIAMSVPRTARRGSLSLPASIVLAIAGLAASTAQAQTLWQAGVDNWFNGLNWTVGVPNAATDAVVNNNGEARINGNALAKDLFAGTNFNGRVSFIAGTLDVNTVSVGSQFGGIGDFTMTGGALTSTSRQTVGGAGTGTFEQSAGDNDVGEQLWLGAAATGNGTYRIQTGDLTADAIIAGVSGQGEFISNGGTSTVGFITAGENNGSLGKLTIGGGTVTATTFAVSLGNQAGSTGTGTQNGGVLNANAGLALGVDAGAAGTYDLSGGTINSSGIIAGLNGFGSFNQSGGGVATPSVTVGFNAGAAGSYGLSGAGTLGTGTTSVGAGAAGASFTQSGGTHTSTSTIVGVAAAGATYAQTGGAHNATNLIVGQQAGSSGTYTYSGGTLTNTDVTIGDAGTGTFNNNRGILGTHTINGSLRVGDKTGAIGDYNLGLFSSINVTGDIHLSRTSGPGSGPPGGVGRLTSNLGSITGTAPLPILGGGSKLYVHGENARFTGAGLYNIGVVYESNPLYGPTGNKPASVEFSHGNLQGATAFKVSNGLIVQNVGAAGDLVPVANEKAATLNAAMLPSARVNIKWGDTAFNADVAYTPGAIGFLSDTRALVTAPFDPTEATGNAAVPAANILASARMWQFGQQLNTDTLNGSKFTSAGDKRGQVRNITSSIDTAGAAFGRTLNVGGKHDTAHGFDIAVDARAATPRHQNPQFEAVHNLGLTGAGVVMGQLEPGKLFASHGCFDNWSTANPNDRRVTLLEAAPGYNQSDFHTTHVASIMVGYDPLGLQVDGQSRFEQSDHRYNNGFGFTGVAPGASLHNTDTRAAGGIGGSVTALAAVPGMKVMNVSAGFRNLGAGLVPDGNQAEELQIDRLVETTSGANANAVPADKGRDGVVFVKSAGNSGRSGASTITVPGGAYNAIVVGNAEYDRHFDGTSNSYPQNFDAAHATINPSSSRGPTNDGRSKPDLVAHGTGTLGAFSMEEEDTTSTNFRNWTTVNDPAYAEEGNRGLYGTRARRGEAARMATSTTSPNPAENGVYNIPADVINSGTSYAAPQVAGLAALMVEDGRTRGNSAAQNPAVIKSIMQSSADKKINGPEAGRWSRGAAGAADNNNTKVPLSYDWGAGLVDPLGAVALSRAGSPANYKNINGDGWVYESLNETDTAVETLPLGFAITGDTYILKNVAAESSLTITLNWFRHVDAAMTSTLYNLDLSLWSFSNLLGGWLPILGDTFLSNSDYDNLEHLWIPRVGAEHAGDIMILVNQGAAPAGGAGLAGVAPLPVGRDEPYALSWTFANVPAPGALALLAMAGLTAARRRRA